MEYQMCCVHIALVVETDAVESVKNRNILPLSPNLILLANVYPFYLYHNSRHWFPLREGDVFRELGMDRFTKQTFAIVRWLHARTV